MDEFEEKLNSVLSDPEQMQKIMSIAQSLGASMPQMTMEPSAQQPPSDQESTEPSPERRQSAPVQTSDAAALLKQASRLDKKQENLLNALRPFLRPARRQKFDRALQIARISHLAGFALKSRNDLPENGR